MAWRESPFENLKVPLTWSAGAALVVAVIAALVALGGGGQPAQAARGHDGVRDGFEAGAAPVSGVLAAPARWIGGFGSGIGDYFFAVRENRRLRAENARLQQEVEQVTALRTLNARYEALLQMRIEPAMRTVGARAVTDARGPFSRARLLDRGSSAGVEVGNPVVNEHGLVGRITGLTGSVSRMVLLTDVSSQAPVLVTRTDARAILRGDGSDTPRLDFLRGGEEALQAGDQILSSGDGGLFPRGMPVGVVARGIDGSWRVKLYSDRGALDLVRIMLFESFSRDVDPRSLEAPPLTGLTPVPPPPVPPPVTTPAQPTAGAPG